MRRTLTLLSLLVLLIFPHPVQAQGNISLDTVAVSVWPEYDRPTVLVIEHMLVSAGTSLPATMTFRIPAAVGKPTAMAVGQTPQTVGDTPYTLKPDGDWIDVIVQVNGPAIQLEYYDPSLVKVDAARQFVYKWSGDYAVKAFHIELQQPLDANGVETDPPLPDISSSSENLIYHAGDFGALSAGQSFSLTVKYQKASDALTISSTNLQPSAPVSDNTTGRVSLQTYLPWIFAGFGVLMLAGGLYYYFRGQPRQRPLRKRRHAASEEKVEGQTYCPQCGTRARNGDRFCRTCGTRLRVEAEE